MKGWTRKRKQVTNSTRKVGGGENSVGRGEVWSLSWAIVDVLTAWRKTAFFRSILCNMRQRPLNYVVCFFIFVSTAWPCPREPQATWFCDNHTTRNTVCYNNIPRFYIKSVCQLSFSLFACSPDFTVNNRYLTALLNTEGTRREYRIWLSEANIIYTNIPWENLNFVSYRVGAVEFSWDSWVISWLQQDEITVRVENMLSFSNRCLFN